MGTTSTTPPDDDAPGAAEGAGTAGAMVGAMAVLLDSAQVFARSLAVAQAAQLAAICEAVNTAKRNPGIYVPEDSTDTHGRAVYLAARAAVLELSMRLNTSESAIWAQYHQADTLIRRMPVMWKLLCAGDVTYRNAAEAATVLWSLPHDDPDMDAAYDEVLSGKAGLTPAQFKKAARATRERLHPADPVERHEQARAGRRVDVDPADDSMAWLSLYSDAATIYTIDARLTAAAARQSGVDGETRTLAQLRADAAGDVLTGAGTPWRVRAHVHLDIPATVLLTDPTLLETAHAGPTEARAVLEGYGPIDDGTARRLCADAPSFRRVFTDPVTGAILNLDRSRYRPTRAQREWLRRQWPTGGSPTRPTTVHAGAGDTDVDHSIDWDFGGGTNIDLLVPLPEAHHTLRHKTKLSYTITAPGHTRWASPTGYQRDTDPPPF